MIRIYMQFFGGRGGSSGRGAGGGTGGGGGASYGSARSFLGNKSDVSDAVVDEINNNMGRQYRREYAEGLAEGGVNDIHFSDMVGYISRNNNVTLPPPENRPYRDVIKDAIGSRAYNALDAGLREGAQRWLNANPRRRRRS